MTRMELPVELKSVLEEMSIHLGDKATKRIRREIAEDADLSLVWPRFAAWMLRDIRPHAEGDERACAAIDGVIAFMSEWVETGIRPTRSVESADDWYAGNDSCDVVNDPTAARIDNAAVAAICAYSGKANYAAKSTWCAATVASWMDNTESDEAVEAAWDTAWWRQSDMLLRLCQQAPSSTTAMSEPTMIARERDVPLALHILDALERMLREREFLAEDDSFRRYFKHRKPRITEEDVIWALQLARDAIDDPLSDEGQDGR